MDHDGVDCGDDMGGVTTRHRKAVLTVRVDWLSDAEWEQMLPAIREAIESEFRSELVFGEVVIERSDD